MILNLLILLFIGVHIEGCSWNTERQVDNQRDFKQLLVDIREQKITPQLAKLEFKRIMSELEERYPHAAFDSANVSLVFPLLGKNYRSVGGRGRGFYGRHFDLFDHSVAKSHPAHDIFIYDRDKDCKEDISGKYMDVLAVSDGVVIATETEWTEEKGYKGGNYVWLYDFQTGGLWYYAHQRKVYVVEGQKVQAGDKIGEVGRSGFNAKTNRSDTHLHLMFLKLDEHNEPTPLNHYPWLKAAKTVYQTQLPSHYPRKSIKADSISKRISAGLPISIEQKIEPKPVSFQTRSKKKKGRDRG
ncbi:M23 family metallopeptidase [Marinilongibacter aquaticus]|uniref:M23 family metallopeptidase n=1 Tax=Marinilongibacter aquaticus TaxID=2975157 RepID=UPI0021BD3CF3|nr:M23 family metallopeptidase [Marinilongibacter aquaticus]UBM60674.1 M23 family metallopeptidase [Marinilongibacter aquaticus]